MMKYLLEGVILGLSYVAPIGMQNLYVINTALIMSKIRTYEVAFITIFFDITLSIASFLGIGLLMDKFYFLKLVIFLVGAIVVFYIGVTLIRFKPKLADSKVNMNVPLCKVVAACFTVTWFNPQAIIDGSLLLGSFRASMPLYDSRFFIIGVCMASFVWFIFLATIFSGFKSMFNENMLRKINVVCGGIVLFYAAKLAYNFLKLVV